MCGRYALYTEVYRWSELGFSWTIDEDFGWTSSYNIAPSTYAPVVLNQDPPVIKLNRWGLVPRWSKDATMGNRMINARIETVAEKPAFRDAIRKRRCLVMANGFYEWKSKGKQKTAYYIQPKHSELFCFAGLWEIWQGPSSERLNTFTILTTEPNELAAKIHHRMPVLLTPEDYTKWLDPEIIEPAKLFSSLEAIPSSGLQAHPVSSFVNNPANNAPECIQPVGLL